MCLLTICSCKDPVKTRKITKDYYLTSYFSKKNTSVLKSNNHGRGGTIIIGETVYAVGFDEKYIIAKQHPKLEYGGSKLDKEITYYHIINISSLIGEKYRFENETEFQRKKDSLGISKKVTFTLIDKDLE